MPASAPDGPHLQQEAAVRTTVFYFSATGNSLAVARTVAARLEADLVDLPSALAGDRIHAAAERGGIVCPAYWGRLPSIVERFFDRLDVRGRYVFLVCTCGGMLRSQERLRRSIADRGGDLAGVFRLDMPVNKFPPRAAKQQAILAAVPRKLDQICGFVVAGRTGRMEKSTAPMRTLMAALAPVEWVIWAYIQARYGLPGRGPGSGPETVRQMDRLFAADARCDGCRMCARVCPVGNIELEGGRPVWQHRCEQCFACYEWCPQEAIVAREGASKRRYHHPEVTLSEILSRPAGPSRADRRSVSDGGPEAER